MALVLHVPRRWRVDVGVGHLRRKEAVSDVSVAKLAGDSEAVLARDADASRRNTAKASTTALRVFRLGSWSESRARNNSLRRASRSRRRSAFQTNRARRVCLVPPASADAAAPFAVATFSRILVVVVVVVVVVRIHFIVLFAVVIVVFARRRQIPATDEARIARRDDDVAVATDGALTNDRVAVERDFGRNLVCRATPEPETPPISRARASTRRARPSATPAPIL